MSNKKIDKKNKNKIKKNKNNWTSSTSFIINAFSATHFIKLLSFSISVLKCKLIGTN